jgi:hypothetical protein
MGRNPSILVMAIFISLVIIGHSLGNSEELICKKTIALSSGEAVCDLSGEWNYEFVSRGDMRAHIGPGFIDVITISQQGNSFTGIRNRGSDYAPKGQVALEGKIDKNGITKFLHTATPLSSGSCKANLSKDGNKIECETVLYYIELTRK